MATLKVPHTLTHPGMPRIGDAVMVRVRRGGDGPRRVRFYPARVHSAQPHTRVGHAAVIMGATRVAAARVIYEKRLHDAPCAYCPTHAQNA